MICGYFHLFDLGLGHKACTVESAILQNSQLYSFVVLVQFKYNQIDYDYEPIHCNILSVYKTLLIQYARLL
jgi:hypothetical protein